MDTTNTNRGRYYTLSLMDLAKHVPAHPECTTYKRRNLDQVSFKIWPDVESLRTAIDKQNSRDTRLNDWIVWINSPMGQRYLESKTRAKTEIAL